MDIGVLLIPIAFNVILCGAMYVTLGLGLMKMAQKLGLPYPWLSWIPAANMFLLVKVAGEKKKKLGLAFLILMFIAIGLYIMNLFTSIFVLDTGLSSGLRALAGHSVDYNWGLIALSGASGLFEGGAAIAAYVLWCILLYHIFRRFKPQYSTVFTVLSVIFGLGPIFILVASFGTPDEQPAPQEPHGPAGTSPSGTQGPPTFTPPSDNSFR